MFNKEVYTERRRKLKQLTGKGIIFLPGNEESSMNYKDNVYVFRQDSCFLYFTGIDRPGLYLLIDIDNDREMVFGNDPGIEETIWTGPLETLALQAEKSGIAFTKPLSDLPRFLKKQTGIHYLPAYRAETALKLSEYLGIPYAQLNERSSVPLIKAIVALRSVKAPEEITEIEKAVDITVQMQILAMQISREGMSEFEIAGKLQGLVLSKGGQQAFPTILTVNGQFLHNHPGKSILRNEQMVLCDCGAESPMHYAGDMTRTTPVSKKFTGIQKELYQIVLDANETAIAALKPGVRFLDVHLLAAETLVMGLKELGFMTGDAKEAVAFGAHTLFFQCGLGHMMGLDVHDMENLGEQFVGYTDDITKSTEFGLRSLRMARHLEPGFVVTIEPGLYFVPDLIDSWKAEKKHARFINYEKLEPFKNSGGIRIEDDLLITASGSRILGMPLEKSISELEGLYKRS